MIEGEAGAGKTTLWLAAHEEARERGYRVLETRPAEAEAGLPFAGLGDLVESTLDEVLDELPEPQADALRVALLLAPPGGAPPDERAVAVAVLGVLRELAGTGPVLVAVDDVQWLDPPSAKVVSFAWRRLREEPVGLLLAHRLGTDAPAGLADDERVSPLAVGPLALGAVHRLLHSRLGLVLPRPALRRVHEVSGGNPFFALELGRALQAHEAELSPGEPLPVPDRLQELVRVRLEALPPESRDVLAAAAALSQPTIGLLAAAVAGGEEALRPRSRRRSSSSRATASASRTRCSPRRRTRTSTRSGAASSTGASRISSQTRTSAPATSRSRRTLRTPTSRARSRRRRSTPAREARPRRLPSCASRRAG